MGVDDGKGRNSGDDLGDSGPSLGADSPGDPGYGPSQEYGAQTRRPQADAGRHHLPDAQWLPVEPSAPGLGDDSTIHRTFQRWVELGVLEGIWAVLVEGCEELGGVDWEWQSADCSMGKARFGGAHWTQPHRRGKAGSKKSILVDAAGGPLSVAVAGANVHDTKLLRPTLESIVVARPEGTQNLCLDKGSSSWPAPCSGTAVSTDYCFEIVS